MRVLFLPWSTQVGGSESFVVRLSHVLRAKLEIDARIVALGEPGPLTTVASEKGVPVAHLRVGTGWRLVSNLPKLRRILAGMLPDVLVPLGYDINLPAMLLPTALAPVVVREAGGALINVTMRGRGLRRHKITVMRRTFAGSVNGEIALSRHMMNAQESLPHARRLVCIPNGVDTEEFSPSAESSAATAGAPRGGDPIVIVGAGRLIEAKGFRTLKTACQSLADRVEGGVVLRLAGTGSLSHELSRSGGCSPGKLRVELLGHVADMPSFWRSGHVAAVPSGAHCHESFGLVAAEAMACGLPVVVTAVGALPEVVRQGETGAVVPPDDPDAMAAALGSYVSDQDLRARQGRAARERALARYSLERAARDYLALFRDVISAWL